jgi:SAM-dependent methyltransferase
MASYEKFARFYDAVNGEPRERILQLLDFVARYRPQAESVLELGCGTGAILAGFGSALALTGVDLSDEMLEYARRRCPTARFIEGDITSFSLGERFDVIICVFDTLNHVTTFEAWLSTFERVREHLNEGGLFIFDVNTLGRLRQLSEMAPWVHDFDGHTLIMEVEFDDEPMSTWDIRVFEQRDTRHYVLHHERIAELGVALSEIREALEPRFTLLEETDTQGRAPTDESARALFVFQLVEVARD